MRCLWRNWIHLLISRAVQSSEALAAKSFEPTRAALKLLTTWCSAASPTCAWLVGTAVWLEPTCSGRSGAACWASSSRKVVALGRVWFIYIFVEVDLTLVSLFRSHRREGGSESFRASHRGHGRLDWQRLLRHGHDHRHGLRPPSDHRGGGCHHDHCSEVNKSTQSPKQKHDIVKLTEMWPVSKRH